MFSKKPDNHATTNRFGFLWTFLSVIFVWPTSAHAWEFEYYTYGGFSDVVSAFNKCALIFSDDGYMILATTIFIGSVAWGMLKAGINKLYGVVPGDGGPPPSYDGYWGTIVNAGVATVLFFGLIVPKGTLHIYDQTENQYQAVGGVPLVGVLAASVSNIIERTMISMVETSGDPLSFSKQAGMKGLQVMNGILARGGETPNGQGTLDQTLDNYIKDCVVMELTRVGTSLTTDEIKKQSPSLVETSFAKAVNPANFTVVFDPALSPQGEAMACDAAWANISTRVNAVKSGDLFKDMKTRACKDGGYSVYDKDAGKASLAYSECVASTDALIKTIDGAWSLDKLILESMFARRFLAFISQESPELMVQSSKAIGVGSQVAEFLQGMASKRGVMVALAAVALPFVCLMMFTQGYKQLLGTIFGLFLLPAVWGILMAAVSDFYLGNMVKAWSTLLNGNWGIDSYAAFGSELMLGASYWGLYLAATFGLAVTLTMKISNSAAALSVMPTAQGAASEGDLSRGRAGGGARLREASATSEGSALASHKMIDNLANSETAMSGMERYQFAQQTGSGVSAGMKDLLNSGQAHAAAAAKTIMGSGVGDAHKLEVIQDKTGGSLTNAAQSAAGAGIQYVTTDAEGNPVVISGAQAVSGAGTFKKDSAPVVEKRTGVSYSESTTESTASPGTKVTELTVAGNGSATITQTRGSWDEKNVQALSGDITGLGVGANNGDFGAIAKKHGISSDTAKSLYQNYQAALAQGMPAEDASKGLQWQIKGSELPVHNQISNVKLSDTTLTGTYGQRMSRSDVAAAEVAQKVDINRLKSEGVGYLQSIGFSQTQSKSIVDSWKNSTGETLGTSTSQRSASTQASTVTSSAGASASVSAQSTLRVGTPDILPVGAKTSVSGGIEMHAGVETNKSHGTQNILDTSVTGTANESSQRSHDLQLQRMVAKAALTARDVKLAESLSQNLGLTESTKAAIGATKEEAVSGGGSENLATYAVNDLVQNKYNSGDIKADVAAAEAFLNSNSNEARDYKEKISREFAQNHHVGEDVGKKVDKAQAATDVQATYNKGPDRDVTNELQDKAGALGGRVKAATAGGPTYNTSPEEKPVNSRVRQAARYSVGRPKAPEVISTPNRPLTVAQKVDLLNQSNNVEKDKQSAIPFVNGNPKAPGTTAAQVRAHGADLFKDKDFGRPGQPGQVPGQLARGQKG